MVAVLTNGFVANPRSFGPVALKCAQNCGFVLLLFFLNNLPLLFVSLHKMHRAAFLLLSQLTDPEIFKYTSDSEVVPLSRRTLPGH